MSANHIFPSVLLDHSEYLKHILNNVFFYYLTLHSMHGVAQYGPYYLPLTVKFYYTILNIEIRNTWIVYGIWLQLELLNVMKSISNKMLFKNIFLIICVLDEF